MEVREMRKFVRDMSDMDLALLLEQTKKEKEHRRQVNLALYRTEVEQLWAALVAKVKELDKMDVGVSADVEDDTGRRYIDVTERLKADGFMVGWHTRSVYKSGD